MTGWVKEIPNRQARQGIRLSRNFRSPILLRLWVLEKGFLGRNAEAGH
jgi:hypothetical protein